MVLSQEIPGNESVLFLEVIDHIFSLGRAIHRLIMLLRRVRDEKETKDKEYEGKEGRGSERKEP